MNRLASAAASLRAGFEEQFATPGAASLFVGLGCNLAFVGQVYFWPAMWHTSALMVSYTDATYVAELLCALLLVLRLRDTARPPFGRAAVWLLAALVQATLVLYCVLFGMGVEIPQAFNWVCGAIFGLYLPVVMLAWFAVHLRLGAARIVWNIMLSAVFASFAIWVFSGLEAVKICVCMGVLLLIGTFVLTRKLAALPAAAEAADAAEAGFSYPPSATFLFSFAFITAISFAGIGGESASFATGAFFAPMLVVCAAALLLNVSSFPLASVAVPAIVMATIAASSLNLDPAISFDLAALGMFLFLTYAVVLLVAGMQGRPREAARAFLGLMVAFAAGCIAGRVVMALCIVFAGSWSSDILIILSIVAANAAMVILIRRGVTPRRAEELLSREESDGSGGAGRLPLAQIDRIAAERNLGEREREVLVLLLEGKSAAEVAREMVVANGTAKSHIRHVYKKLGVHSRDELFDMFGVSRGSVTSPEPGRR
ncbi:LuxR C-terminal-related transcriptional regulator [uncultured Adlercreutzia sp.]|uniref:helix-turn-helix transcriptional regulator n=1 Tax=uncultured Adlercreutzia sp. TaxID=875803 RepID=UPI0026759657|nr:LuxR C-terminal-related transcriptional regulator [uncultured Adlercreutzia sp.]